MWILHVLDEEGPKNGVEIMDAVQVHTERSDRVNRDPHGAPRNTRPLPGSIYPMLKKMVSEKLLTKREDGRYELTKTGQDLNSKLLGRFKGIFNEEDHRVWNIKNVLTEIDSYLSYLEYIKTEKLVPHKEQIEIITKRIKKINKSLINK
jgi:DNA-binding PadR family transcriptional regulator